MPRFEIRGGEQHSLDSRYIADIDSTSSYAVISEEHRKLAVQLSAIHGHVHLARERSGVHLYCCCPDCLEKFGKSELSKRHLAINLDKFLAGEFTTLQGGTSGESKSADLCACCMKTGKPFSMSELMSMQPLEKRGIPNVESKVIEMEPSLEDCEAYYGHIVPKLPGECVPVPALSHNHPAVKYLSQRGYDLKTLWHMFHIEWCTEERHDREYAPLKGGFKATPQNRIIFYIYQDGIRCSWQARILQKDEGDQRYYFHPYLARYVAMQQRKSSGDGWEELYPPFEKKLDLRKYLFPPGTKRSNMLAGFDAAVMFNKGRDKRRRYLVINEGPLSAGKLGPPGVAALGKFFSDAQGEIARRYPIVLYAKENDTAGNEGANRFLKVMSRYPDVTAHVIELPQDVKDLGDCSTERAQEIVQKELESI
jgi:hypothetical protein